MIITCDRSGPWYYFIIRGYREYPGTDNRQLPTGINDWKGGHMDLYQTAILTGIASMIIGFICFLLVMKFLPYLEQRENLSQKEEVLREAGRQAEVIKETARQQSDENNALLQEESEASIQEQQELLNSDEQELAAQEQYYQQELKRVEKNELSLKTRTDQASQANHQLKQLIGETSEARQQLILALAKGSSSDAEKLRADIREQMIEERQLECQKVLKSLTEELNLATRKKAQRILDRVHARYTPEFIWPKPSNVIEVSKSKALTQLTSEHCPLIEELSGLSGASIKVIANQQEGQANGIVKVSGGMGYFEKQPA